MLDDLSALNPALPLRTLHVTHARLLAMAAKGARQVHLDRAFKDLDQHKRRVARQAWEQRPADRTAHESTQSGIMPGRLRQEPQATFCTVFRGASFDECGRPAIST